LASFSWGKCDVAGCFKAKDYAKAIESILSQQASYPGTGNGLESKQEEKLGKNTSQLPQLPQPLLSYLR